MLELPRPAGHVRPVLPLLDDSNRFFWQSGRSRRLKVLHCQACGYWIHPPSPRCPSCLSRTIEARSLSGRGRIHTFTINYQKWPAAPDPPYAIAVVTMAEQQDLRLTSRLVDIDLDAIVVGLKVRVVFERWDDVWIPLFTGDEAVGPEAGAA